jgi:hypothetical protein
MRKIFCLLAVAVLLSSVALAGTEQSAKPSQPRIFDPKISISFTERTMEISFRYEEVAGHIDDAKKVVVIGTASISGGTDINFIPLRVADPRGKRGDGITPEVMTQGSVKYYAVMPDALVISDPEEIFIAGIAVIDGLGREVDSVYIKKQSEEKNKPVKFGI